MRCSSGCIAPTMRQRYRPRCRCFAPPDSATSPSTSSSPCPRRCDVTGRATSTWRSRSSPEHLSLYGLTIEAGHAARALDGTGREHAATRRALRRRVPASRTGRSRAAGFDHYEVSNAARPGYRARHNSAYWRRAPFIGLGPSAHSALADATLLERPRMGQLRAPVRGRPAGPGRRGDSWNGRSCGSRQLYLGLRTSDGLACEPDSRRPQLETGSPTAGPTVDSGRAPPHRRGLAPARCAGPLRRLSMSLALTSILFRPILSDRRPDLSGWLSALHLTPPNPVNCCHDCT